MKNAQQLILEALQNATQIQAAGKESLLALAARAVNPDNPLSREGVASTLDLPPCLVIAILVSADLADNTEARRGIGLDLFERIPLDLRLESLTPEGELVVAVYCLEQLSVMDESFTGLIGQTLRLARQRLAGETADALALKEAERQAMDLQRTKVVAMEKGTKSKLGVPLGETLHRRGAQAIRALLAGLRETSPSEHLSPTVAGEVAAVLALSQGTKASTDFCVDLAQFLRALPPHQTHKKPEN
jgi:hypothetical protein